MRILAVIPARAGSKGIPNKNIRLLNDCPLISYAINNAKQSQYITDVVVSTDSETVEMISRQLGVEVKRRDKRLCADSVTLDAVVYDASKDRQVDYIVTMQPTSPTLKVETLDAAIQYMICKDLDTLISAINKPHLSWSSVRGKKVPNYKERLNRQYLPENYLETGAFVISKSAVVCENSRIGKKVDIYEISEEEAIDIDTFADLKLAEMYLKKNHIAMYVNGNNQIGLGHVSRVLELADEFYSKPDIYFDSTQTKRETFGETTHTLIPIRTAEELLSNLVKKDYQMIINDVLDTSADYMQMLKKNTCAHVVNFEDDGEGARYADVVINALYDNSTSSNVKCGFKYYIVPRNFTFFTPIQIKEEVQNIFVCFGGADPQNYTDRVLNIIKNDIYQKYKFHVVLGRAKQNADELRKYNRFDNINIYHDVENIAEIMSICDIGLTSRGRTGYELAYLGIPTLAMAQNEREELHKFISRENGFFYLGKNPSDYIIEKNLNMVMCMNKLEREEVQKQLLMHELKQGRNRVMGIINSL